MLSLKLREKTETKRGPRNWNFLEENIDYLESVGKEKRERSEWGG